jgi:hypothetical protein
LSPAEFFRFRFRLKYLEFFDKFRFRFRLPSLQVVVNIADRRDEAIEGKGICIPDSKENTQSKTADCFITNIHMVYK